MAKTKQLTRHYWSTAYVDSGLVGGYIVGLVAFAVWVSTITATVVSPQWLSASIVTIGVYEMLIVWLIRQYSEANKIFAIFVSNVICLSSVLVLVGVVFNVNLPADLPVLNVLLHLAGIQATSVSPGAVAVSYAAVGIVAGLFSTLLFSLFEDRKPFVRLKRLLFLDRLDLRIDVMLDRYSFWMDKTKHWWFIAPQILLVAVCLIVVGGAALL